MATQRRSGESSPGSVGGWPPPEKRSSTVRTTAHVNHGVDAETAAMKRSDVSGTWSAGARCRSEVQHEQREHPPTNEDRIFVLARPEERIRHVPPVELTDREQVEHRDEQPYPSGPCHRAQVSIETFGDAPQRDALGEPIEQALPPLVDREA